MISKYRYLEYSSSHKGYLTASEYIDGLVKYRFLLQKTGVHPVLPTTKAYRQKIPINQKKMEYIRKIIQYIPDDKKEFYESILTWPTTSSEIPAEDEN